MKNYQGIYCLALGILVLTIAGCTSKSRKPDNMPDLYPLTVKIVYDDGAPVADATVQLVDKTQSWVVGGKTDAQGNAIIQAQGEFPGAPAGNYKVVVNKMELVYGEETPDAPAPITGRFNHVEKKYTMIQSTDLTLEVKPDTKSAELKVGKAVREAIAGPLN